MTTRGVKHDANKPRWSLLPWEALIAVVAVLEHGAQKYAPNNWRIVENWRERYFNAAQRHIIAWHMGERVDAESGQPHIAHAVCCLLYCLALDRSAVEREASSVEGAHVHPAPEIGEACWTVRHTYSARGVITKVHGRVARHPGAWSVSMDWTDIPPALRGRMPFKGIGCTVYFRSILMNNELVPWFASDGTEPDSPPAAPIPPHAEEAASIDATPADDAEAETQAAMQSSYDSGYRFGLTKALATVFDALNGHAFHAPANSIDGTVIEIDNAVRAHIASAARSRAAGPFPWPKGGDGCWIEHPTSHHLIVGNVIRVDRDQRGLGWSATVQWFGRGPVDPLLPTHGVILLPDPKTIGADSDSDYCYWRVERRHRYHGGDYGVPFRLDYPTDDDTAPERS